MKKTHQEHHGELVDSAVFVVYPGETMPIAPFTFTAMNSKYSFLLFPALIVAGLAGNYFNYSIFHNINFLFGGIFAMLALQFFGLGRGILAAAIIAGYTYFLWNHPYAIIFMTAEVATVGWLMIRRKIGLVLADTLFWFLVGMPLVYLFYHVAMHVPLEDIYIVMTKHAVNGIANALVARLIFTGYALWSRSSLTSYSEIVYNLLAFFVLCSVLIILAVESRADFTETDLRIRSSLIRDRESLSLRLGTWVVNRKSAIFNLAEMAASKSPQQMQPSLEQANKSDLNFQRIGLIDREGTTVAFYPLVDERGRNSIGKNYADRPFIPTLKQTLKPMLSEEVMSRFGTPGPMVAILVPVVARGEYGGFVAGILSLAQIHEHLDKSVGENTTLYTLLDKNGNVIMTNRTDQTVMTPFARGKGSLTRLDKEISNWVPAVSPNTPAFEHWQRSFYVAEAAIGDMAEWRLILEQPVAPFQTALFKNYSGKLSLLFLILLVALALAELLSRRFIVTLEKLRLITHDLPARLATDNNEIVWPESSIKETNHLITNFREMAESLSAQFYEIRQINDSLEQRVEERTKELQDSESQNRALISAIPDLIFTNRRDGEFLTVHASDPTQLMAPPEMFLHRSPRDILPDLLADQFINTCANALESESVQDLNYTLSVGGQERHFEARVVPYTEESVITIVRDITTRKLTEESLQESEERFRSLMENIPSVAVQGYTLDGTVLFWNRASEQLYGYSAAEALGANLLDLIIPPEMREGVMEAIRQMAASGQAIPAGELLLKCKDGSFVPVFSSHALVNPVSRKPELFCLDIDLTERKRAEEALRKSESLYHSLVETSQDLIWQCDAEGRYTYLNLAWEQVFGYELNEMLGRKFTDFQPSVTAERDQQIYHRLMEGSSVNRLETTHIGKAGNEIHLVFNALFMSDEHGNIIGSNGTAYDITERKRAEGELHQAKAAAEAANIAKSQFLANMSHEIRTPMNGVIGLTELLLGTELTVEQREYAELVKLSGRNLVQLISDILDLSKIEAHKVELDIRNFDLRAETTGTVNLLSLRAQEKCLELGFQIDPDVPLLLKGDTGRLRQIITNLIDNAIKFTTRGSISLQVRTEAEDDLHATLRFLVRDSGIGIAENKLESIFKPFTQADGSTTRKFGGTGLGLTISRQLAELMGGYVGVESAEGEGSIFWFTVVMEKQANVPLPASPLLLEVNEIPSPTGGGLGRECPGDTAIRLLLVEDDPTNQMVTQSILVKCGYQVDVAGNGREALKLLERNNYDLVLMDSMMPVMNGSEATAVIRDQSSAVRNHAIPVIALTANAMQEDRTSCLAAGMDDYLSKPLEIGDLLALLEKWLPFSPARRTAAKKTIRGEEGKTGPVFNRDEFVRRNCDDLELSRDVAAIFIDHRQEYTESIRMAASARDADALRQTAHKLKGAAANIALPLLAETAGAIESVAVTGDLEKAGELLPELELRFEQAVEAIRKLLVIP